MYIIQYTYLWAILGYPLEPDVGGFYPNKWRATVGHPGGSSEEFYRSTGMTWNDKKPSVGRVQRRERINVELVSLGSPCSGPSMTFGGATPYVILEECSHESQKVPLRGPLDFTGCPTCGGCLRG